MTGGIKGITDHVLHGLEHFLNKFEEGLDAIRGDFGLVTLEIHNRLHAQNRILLVLDPYKLHQGIDHISRIRLDVGRSHGQPVKGFEDAVPKFLYRSC